jgi:hypothetical protein
MTWPSVMADSVGAHDSGQSCTCVSDHNPEPRELNRHHIWPKGAGGPDTPENLVWLCPTSHVNVHDLEREWVRYEGEPPWPVRRGYGPTIRELARRAYQSTIAGRLVP